MIMKNRMNEKGWFSKSFKSSFLNAKPKCMQTNQTEIHLEPSIKISKSNNLSRKQSATVSPTTLARKLGR
jgi:phage FluMu protein Com